MIYQKVFAIALPFHPWEAHRLDVAQDSAANAVMCSLANEVRNKVELTTDNDMARISVRGRVVIMSVKEYDQMKADCVAAEALAYDRGLQAGKATGERAVVNRLCVLLKPKESPVVT